MYSMRARSVAASRSAPSLSRGREITGIVLLSLAIFLGISLISLLFADGRWLGQGGAWAARLLYSAAGLPALFFTYAIGRIGVRVLSAEPILPQPATLAGIVLSLLAAVVLLDLCLHDQKL